MDFSQMKGAEILTCLTALILALVIFKLVLFPQKLVTADAKKGAVVPKGTFGLPYIGEVVQFALNDPVSFCKPRIAK